MTPSDAFHGIFANNIQNKHDKSYIKKVDVFRLNWLKLGHKESAVLRLDLWKADTDYFYKYKNKFPNNEASSIEWAVFLTHLDIYKSWLM